MTDEALAILRSHGTTRRFDKGQVAITFGDAYTHAMILEEGSFSFSITEEDGTTLNYGYMGPGAVWGLSPLLRETPASFTFAAAEESVLSLVSRETLWSLIDNNPIVRRGVILQLCWAIAKANRLGHEERANPLRCRLAMFLIRRAGQSDVIDLTQAELAQNLGASRYAVGQHLQRLKNLSLIDIQYGRVTIKDKDGLMQYADAH